MIYKYILVSLLIFILNIADVESSPWRRKLCVAGLIVCNRMPYKDIKVTLYQKNIFGVAISLKSVHSYCNGNFIIEKKTNLFSKKPAYLVIKYTYSRFNVVCKFTETISIPERHVTRSSHKNKSYFLGTIYLMRIPAQENKCYYSHRETRIKK